MKINKADPLAKRLIALIRERAVIRYCTPCIKLSSGLMSTTYFDLKTVSYSSEGAYLIGTTFCAFIEKSGLKPQAIGGLTLGADPIAVATSLCSFMLEKATFRTIEPFTIRKEPKEHGTAKYLEGNVKAGDHVIIVDDVITTGSSMIHAIEIAKVEGLLIDAVFAILDREEVGGKAAIERLGYPVTALFTVKDILSS